MEDLKVNYGIPRFVSIGPYHHGTTAVLQQMESVKHVAAWHFIDDSDFLVDDVYGAVCAVADEARSYYDRAKMATCDDDVFKPMLFYDGCFLLQFMLHLGGRIEDDESGIENEVLRDAFSSNESGISRDIVLLENQLPWVVVDTLREFMSKPPNLQKITAEWNASLQSRKVGLEKHVGWEWDDEYNYKPVHLLDLLLFYIAGSTARKKLDHRLTEEAKKLRNTVSAMELAEIGIKIKANKPNTDLKEMRFKTSCLTGELYFSPLSLDDANASFLLNMAALELCTAPNFLEYYEEASTVCSYLCLLGMVTDKEEDVEELRKQGILKGGAGLSNKEALKFLNSVEGNVRPGVHYLSTMVEIEEYKDDKWKRIMFHKFHYNHRRAIFLTVSGIAGLVSFLATLKSFR